MATQLRRTGSGSSSGRGVTEAVPGRETTAWYKSEVGRPAASLWLMPRTWLIALSIEGKWATGILYTMLFAWKLVLNSYKLKDNRF